MAATIRRSILSPDEVFVEGAELDENNPVTRGMVFAGLPTGNGYWDASKYANHAWRKKGANALPAISSTRNGPYYAFTTSDAFSASSFVPISTAGFSVALWVRFPTSTPTAYGSHVGRAGTTGATAAGGDWEIAPNNTSRNLVYARNGAIIAASSGAMAGALWYLWSFSLGAAGDWNWRLAGDDTTTVGKGSGSGVSIRTAPGQLNINGRSTDASNSSNSAIGRVYIWDRAITGEDHNYLFENEANIIAQRRRLHVVSGAAGAAPTLSDLKAVSITSSSVQGTYDYAF